MTDAINEENKRKKEAAEKEANEIISIANDRAKKQTDRTQELCAEMIAECEADIKNRQDEFSRVAKKAAEFRAMLFGVYSEHLLSLENIVIPEEFSDSEKEDVLQTEQEKEKPVGFADLLVDDDVIDDDGFIEEKKILPLEDDIEISEPDLTENDAGAAFADQDIEAVPSVEAAADTVADVEYDKDAKQQSDAHKSTGELTDAEPTVYDAVDILSPGAVSKEAPEAASGVIYGSFDVETEQSGQVHYDSTDISSVNKKLDDIMKNKTEAKAGSGVSQKLGFLK